MADVATLGLSVESSQVKKGARDLDDLSNSAKRAEGATGILKNAFARLEAALASIDRSVGRVEAAVLGLSKQAGAAEAKVVGLGNATGRAGAQFGQLSVSGAKVSVTFGKVERAAHAAETAVDSAAASSRIHETALENEATAADAAAAATNRLTNARRRVPGAVPFVDGRRANPWGNPQNDNRPGRSGGGPGLFNTANIAAQFQDIGVTAAMGMNPLQIALQQGTQLVGVLQTMEKPLAGLRMALFSLVSTVSLVTIGLTALAVVGLQMVNWPALAAAALNGLASAIEAIAPYAVTAAAAVALIYAPAVLGGLTMLSEAILGVTARLIGLAAGFLMANPATAFVLGVTAAVAAATIFGDELAQVFGVDIVGAAKTGVNYIIGSFVAAFHDIQFIWSQLPNIVGAAAVGAANAAIGAIQSMINAAAGMLDSLIDKVNGALAKLPGGFSIGKIGSVDFGKIANPFADALGKANAAHASQIQSDLSQDYLGDFGGAIAKGASAASGKLKELAGWMTTVDEKGKKGGKGSGGKTEADKYQDIVDGANRRIASLQAEQAALGLTETEALRLKYTQDLLNQAQQKGITLTAAQKAELAGLANTMATTEVATKKAKEAFEFAKDATKGFLSDLRQGLANGEGFWKSFGNAALNVLNKIIDKIETQLVDALFSATSAGSSGGGGGGGIFGMILRGIGSIFGFASGGYTGRGAASSVAGVVHGGEYVFSKKATDRIGIGALDQLHQRAKGYAGGGYVTPAPRITPSANQNGGREIIDIRLTDDSGRMAEIADKQIHTRSGAIVQLSVQKSQEATKKNMPGYVSDVMERHG